MRYRRCRTECVGYIDMDYYSNYSNDGNIPQENARACTLGAYVIFRKTMLGRCTDNSFHLRKNWPKSDQSSVVCNICPFNRVIRKDFNDFYAHCVQSLLTFTT